MQRFLDAIRYKSPNAIDTP